jgi:hypothetical protein
MARVPHPQRISSVCEHGAMCVDDRPGHALTIMRLRLAIAGRRGWIDALVERADADGLVELRTFASGETVTVWHHADLGAELTPGTPVALHAAFGVLAAGSRRISVARD